MLGHPITALGMPNRTIFTALIALFFLLSSQPVSAAAPSTPRALSALPEQRETIPQEVLPLVVAPKASETSKSLPTQFAVAVDWPRDTNTSGLWSRADNGDHIWRLRILSVGAVSLNLAFDRFRLPEGAALFLYDSNGDALRRYTSADQNEDNQLWTAPVNGDEIIIELNLPATERNNFDLRLMRVNHAYIDVFGLSAGPRLFAARSTAGDGGSGACHIDAVCPQADPFRSQLNSAARISISGTSLCSAVLLNNLRQDFRPYLLTAFHCGIDAANDTSVVAFWNFENSSCGAADDAGLSQTLSGSTHRAGRSDSDFTLIEMNNAIPASFNATWSGWDATGSPPQCGYGIHHPQGDPLAASLSTTPATAADDVPLVGPGINQSVDTWVVRWNQGVTEQGSSGSGFWNEHHLIVGQLSGGNSSCGTPNETDVYGRFSESFDASPLPTEQLKFWLDPDLTGAEFVGGRNASSIFPPSGNPGSTQPELCGINVGQSVSATSNEDNGGGGGGGAIGWLSVFSSMIVLWVRQRSTRQDAPSL